MIDISKFHDKLIEEGIGFFTGVPDSYLNNFCNFLNEKYDKNKHVIAANEGNAIGIAAGHYFATKKLPLVYMQNSGIGNAINPLVSLADENVYNVPMLLLIGWRGQPQTGDWAQHKLQGELTTKLLEDMGIEYGILSTDMDDNFSIIEKALESLKERKRFAIISPNKILNGEKANLSKGIYPLSRSKAMEIILDRFPKDVIYSASTGRMTRELYHLRKFRNESHEKDFLNVGSMGHASSVALGIALANKNRKVVVLDGDAAAIMHMGSFTMASKYAPSNYFHIVINNGVHESVGGQPSVGFDIDFTKVAEGSGYKTIEGFVSTEEEIFEAIDKLNVLEGPKFLEIRVHQGMERKLPELDITHIDIINELIEELN